MFLASQSHRHEHIVAHKHMHIWALLGQGSLCWSQEVYNSALSHCTTATHNLLHIGEVLGLVRHVTRSRHEWIHSLGMFSESRRCTFFECEQHMIEGNGCVCLCICGPHGAPVCECKSVSARRRASETGMCHSSCKPLSSQTAANKHSSTAVSVLSPRPLSL